MFTFNRSDASLHLRATRRLSTPGITDTCNQRGMQAQRAWRRISPLSGRLDEHPQAGRGRALYASTSWSAISRIRRINWRRIQGIILKGATGNNRQSMPSVNAFLNMNLSV